MGKIVQINAGFSGVNLPPGRNYNAGDSTTLTDTEYANLSAATLRAVSVITSGVADPIRSGNNNPISLADAVTQANAYTDSKTGAVTTNSQTSNYTLVSNDSGVVVELNSASGVTVTIPPNSSVAFSVGTVIEVFQYGSGQVTIAAGAGVALRTASTLTARAQYSSISLRKRATDEWVVAGDLT
jgi:uncharacterized membrane protein (DUF441 family)